MQNRRRWRRRLRLEENDFVFLWPGGIRAVKDPLFLLRAFAPLRVHHPHARLLFVGPILERDYGRRFRAALRKVRGATYQPAVPPAAMRGFYAAVDTMVNSSISEGMSNSLLEAMATGVPVLARSNEGNSAVVSHGRTGLLFSSEQEFLRQATRLLADAQLRRRLARAARREARRHHNAASEAAAHLRLYHRLMPRSRHARA